MTVMHEDEKSWLAGLFDGRGSIAVSESGNVIGTVSINFTSEFVMSAACAMIESSGIECKRVGRVGKLFKLNFTSSRGAQLLEVLKPYMRNPVNIRRADVFIKLFPPGSEGKHMKIERMEGYADWLALMKFEYEIDERDNVMGKISGGVQ